MQIQSILAGRSKDSNPAQDSTICRGILTPSIHPARLWLGIFRPVSSSPWWRAPSTFNVRLCSRHHSFRSKRTDNHTSLYKQDRTGQDNIQLSLSSRDLIHYFSNWFFLKSNLRTCSRPPKKVIRLLNKLNGRPADHFYFTYFNSIVRNTSDLGDSTGFHYSLDSALIQHLLYAQLATLRN